MSRPTIETVLRDAFAADAMRVLTVALLEPAATNEHTPRIVDWIAKQSYQIADAMMAHRMDTNDRRHEPTPGQG